MEDAHNMDGHRAFRFFLRFGASASGTQPAKPGTTSRDTGPQLAWHQFDTARPKQLDTARPRRNGLTGAQLRAELGLQELLQRLVKVTHLCSPVHPLG
jgi:hypothetical protein